MIGLAPAALALVALAAVLGPHARAEAASRQGWTMPASFTQIDRGPAGGTVWQGVIPNRVVPTARRVSVIYLPPAVSVSARYPVLYLLQGFHGGPHQYFSGLRLAQFADRAIAAHRVPPFIAVAAPAGVSVAYDGEWAGVWERYFVRDVVPWVDGNLPTRSVRTGRAVAGLSAGGYGAVDIGLRHPRLFGTLESWSGYFDAPHDGPLTHADPAALAAHDPSLLVRQEAPELRTLGTRFFLSSGTTHDHPADTATRAFAGELATLGLPHRLLLRSGGHDGKFWRAQLPAALRYAFR